MFVLWKDDLLGLISFPRNASRDLVNQTEPQMCLGPDDGSDHPALDWRLAMPRRLSAAYKQGRECC